MSVDKDGQPVGLTLSAFGDVLPLWCPQCDREHTEWTHSAPYGAKGLHVSGALLNPMPSSQHEPIAIASQVPSPPVFAPRPSVLRLDAEALSLRDNECCVVCGLCDRRVLRVGADDKGLALERSAYGHPIPLLCPSCLVSHTDWKVATVKPLPL